MRDLERTEETWICPHCKTKWHLMEGYELLPDGTKVCKNPRCGKRVTDEDVYR